jgi:uncharacterized protein (TIGR02118 family)
MKRLLVLYGMPTDPQAFDRHYREVHIPLTRKMPRLHAFEISKGPVSTVDDSRYYLVALLTYRSQEDLDFSLASAEGGAAVNDVGNFASGGVQIITIDVEPLL